MPTVTSSSVIHPSYRSTASAPSITNRMEVPVTRTTFCPPDVRTTLISNTGMDAPNNSVSVATAPHGSSSVPSGDFCVNSASSMLRKPSPYAFSGVVAPPLELSPIMEYHGPVSRAPFSEDGSRQIIKQPDPSSSLHPEKIPVSEADTGLPATLRDASLAYLTSLARLEAMGTSLAENRSVTLASCNNKSINPKPLGQNNMQAEPPSSGKLSGCHVPKGLRALSPLKAELKKLDQLVLAGTTRAATLLPERASKPLSELHPAASQRLRDLHGVCAPLRTFPGRACAPTSDATEPNSEGGNGRATTTHSTAYSCELFAELPLNEDGKGKEKENRTDTGVYHPCNEKFDTGLDGETHAESIRAVAAPTPATFEGGDDTGCWKWSV